MSTIDELSHTFGVEEGGLAGPEAILRLQRVALERDPPPGLPEAARAAAAGRLASGEPVIPRLRFPIETGRVAELMARLAQALLGEAEGLVHERLSVLIGDAALAGAQGDAAGVRRALGALAVPAETAESLFREALKPELLRSSRPFAELVLAEPRGRRCPLCESVAAAGTPAGERLCSFCGTLWRRAAAECSSCGSAHLRLVELRELSGAALEQCSGCGEALGIFEATAEPLGLSLFAVLGAPLRTVARVNAGAEPETGYRVF